MKIDRQDIKIIFEFTPREYFLVHAKDDRFPNSNEKVWTLNPRIDMSYKGKDDQIALPVLYLSDTEAEACKKAGFTYIEDFDKIA